MSEIRRLPVQQSATGDAPAADAVAHRCDECGAPVEERQRYCVVCGAHRRHVPDPAARYLSEASARARSSARAGAVPKRPSRAARLSLRARLRIAVVLIPVALVIGLLLGNSSTPATPAHSRTPAAARHSSPPAAGSGSATHIKQSTGSSYVNSQNNLPGSVSVP